jgi:hypothetical protein
MPSLMQFLAITAAVLFTTTNAANAMGYSPDADPSSVGSIIVKIDDNAKNSCWTNLREAREYAEEKLEIEGYNVLAESGEYGFNIRVVSERDNRGVCWGYIYINIWAFGVRNDVSGIHEIGSGGGAVLNQDNLNTYVIKMISQMVAQM